MSFPHTADSKKRLRAEMRRMAAAGDHDSVPVAAAVDAWLAAHPVLQTIAAFAALPGEVDLASVVANHPERRWAYPRVVGTELVFHAVNNPALEMVAGKFGVREPLPSLAVLEPREIGAFLCPGLAFDARGGRLGRGMGYYDRLLAHARPDALRVGVCFPWQIVPDTHDEPHDIHMDVVICGG